uniref:NYN domain-containing protein n=1 Tax=candidate division WOR-3 bacterium TaxID=2052148 RepID=A0A7C2P092_UNCW3
MKIHIIDGYNAIYSIKFFTQSLQIENGLELAREEIIRKCAEKFKGSFIIVFDGRIGGKHSNTPNVIFTSDGVTADELILDLVSKYRSKKYVVYVYSRDRSLREKAKLRGAIPLDPQEVLKGTKKTLAKEDFFDMKSKKLKNYNWEKEFGISEEEQNERI